ncbi:MAG: class I SAM-dependent methyltransferase [Kiritimatiellia bacterium]|jgi:SAM-dependent methyltransferase
MSTHSFLRAASDAFQPMSPWCQECDAVQHSLSAFGVHNKTCLDVGLENPYASLELRKPGGFWYSVARDAESAVPAAELLQEDVVPLGPQGELPFDDRQFDVVVLANGMIVGDADRDIATLQEAHRVLRSSGILVASIPHRRPSGLANLFHREAAYTDKQVFELFKQGFDVLRGRTYCRFWTHLALSSGYPPGLAAAARWLDRFVWTPGYRKVFAGRRKLWRPRLTPVLRDGRSLSEAVLFPFG